MSPNKGGEYRGDNGHETLVDLVQRAVTALRTDAKEAYAELTREYNGSSVSLAVFGLGSVLLSVASGEVHVGREAQKQEKMAGRAAIYPETLVALMQGELTPLEAYHRGELLARAPSEDLHTAYGYLVKFSEVPMRSKGMQEALRDFRAKTGT